MVDNASTDKSYKEYTQKFPDVNLIENSKNLGYCEGNNVGIRATKGEFVVVLNPDTIVNPTWLHELLHAYKKNGEGIYQPKILATTDHDMLLSSGQFIQLFGFGYSRGKGETHIEGSNNIEKIGTIIPILKVSINVETNVINNNKKIRNFSKGFKIM